MSKLQAKVVLGLMGRTLKQAIYYYARGQFVIVDR